MSEFSADVGALSAAANGIGAVVRQLEEHPIRDIDCPAAAVGHERLAGTLRDCCGRWQLGVHALAEDGRQIAGRLAETAQTYAQADAAAVDALAQAVAGVDLGGASADPVAVEGSEAS